jgi:hypothetical protein
VWSSSTTSYQICRIEPPRIASIANDKDDDLRLTHTHTLSSSYRQAFCYRFHTARMSYHVHQFLDYRETTVEARNAPGVSSFLSCVTVLPPPRLPESSTCEFVVYDSSLSGARKERRPLGLRSTERLSRLPPRGEIGFFIRFPLILHFLASPFFIHSFIHSLEQNDSLRSP